MKTLLFANIMILAALLLSGALGDDSKTVSGKQYGNAQASRIEPDNIVVNTKSGVSDGGGCSWSAGADMPVAAARGVGVYLPDNGKFYFMGGSDANNVALTNPLEYDPAANTWTAKSASYPDANTNDMACGVLRGRLTGRYLIYCAGGSITGRVFAYDPVADVITTGPASSSWPPGAPGDYGRLPGGFTVLYNALFILGGFNTCCAEPSDEIWSFATGPGSWFEGLLQLPVPLCYIPTTTIGNLIYTGGGADITGGTMTDTTNSFVYDGSVFNTIADIPRPTSNTQAVNFCNQMYVLGGGFSAPSNEVDIYDPTSNTWSVGLPFPTAGRNFAAGSDGTSHIWKAGGYAEDGVSVVATTEVFNCPVNPCRSLTPTPTATATPTMTATATATATATLPPSPTPTATATSTATVSSSPTPTPSEAPCAAFDSQPACNSTVVTQLTDFFVYISGFVDSLPPPSVFTVNGIPADTINGGGSTLEFHFNVPPVIPGQNTMDIPPGAFTCSNSGRGFEGFHCTFTYQPSTPTPTPRPSPTPRLTPTPRLRPTPGPRP